MSRITRCLLALGALTLVTGCGGGSSASTSSTATHSATATTATTTTTAPAAPAVLPENTVAEVGGNTITNAMLAHWATVGAAIDYNSNPSGPPPSWLIPDPPSYSTCIAHLRATAAKPAKGQPGPTTAQLKDQCQNQYVALRQLILTVLIRFDWITGESAELGINLSPAELQEGLARAKRENYPTEAAFHNFLRYTGLSLPDELLRIKIEALSAKLKQRTTANKGFTQEYTSKWTARTNCSSGYVVLGCSEYKGSQAG